MYERQYGDNLYNKDKRLKLKWDWSRIASLISPKELKKWTHFQCSEAEFKDWTLKVIQWQNSYEANISSKSARIAVLRIIKHD